MPISRRLIDCQARALIVYTATPDAHQPCHPRRHVGVCGTFANLPGHFRETIALSIASIGIGTYLGEPDEETDRAYEASVRAAILGGINLIDTAVNYRLQRSERAIGNAIRALVAGGQIRREEVSRRDQGRLHHVRRIGARRSARVVP